MPEALDRSSVGAVILPPPILLDPLLRQWLLEDIGRGDRTTQGILADECQRGRGEWIAKQTGIIAGLPIAARVFQLLDAGVSLTPCVEEGEMGRKGQPIAVLEGSLASLLTGERVALNLAMRLSGIATTTRQYVEKIADLPVRLVDTRKTTPGMRLLEKYATQIGGAINHRHGLDDAVMIKDNHIRAAGSISAAISRVRQRIPYPLSVEVETTTLAEVEAALQHGADIIMLDNMAEEPMRQAVNLIRRHNAKIAIEASGNITLETIRAVANTGVDYISSSAPITQSPWLDLSMSLEAIAPS